MEKLTEKVFANDFVNTFEGDQSGDLTPRQTPGVLYSKAIPTPVAKPTLLAWSDELGDRLKLSKPTEQSEIDILAGNLVLNSMQPYAACYAGHQFGSWAGQLGDGRAIALGELRGKDGKPYEIQLKGAGPTPYSRRADGRAVLRSSVREYLMSEAMFYLGVPTTRALSLVNTGDQVLRDMFYNGHPDYEPGAIVARVAPGFLRFGNFEMLSARKEYDNLKKLMDWTIARYYPHISEENKYIKWFNEILDRTATLMVDWMRVGFVHGVMNTDNMSILGLTIDYGPYSFLDDYDPEFTPNTTDLPGKRYAFGNQAPIAYWNLGALANAIAPIVKDIPQLKESMAAYEDIFLEKYIGMMANKLGFDAVLLGDRELIIGFDQMLEQLKPDMTIFYQLLIDLPANIENHIDLVNFFDDALYSEPSDEVVVAFYKIIKEYQARLKSNSISEDESRKKMHKANPRFVLRNYLLHQAIEELTKGESQLFEKLQEAIKDPYSSRFDEFFKKRPDWANQKAGCSMLSCSS
jgi:uncharacterized protein YdiU (UPF0061 family)